eukprot:TRINITY_DN17111_c0_g1_i1.p1 TRINITY_DN17111_c0_g1~~TRINITY_DN17111_c0_g1_i1.p1  ORF type:complete len:686 (+),score=88.50 TRINITY_DN17111_c0_g1_i1:111-2168(+)
MVRMLQKSTVTRQELHDELVSFGDELQKKLSVSIEHSLRKLERARSSERRLSAPAKLSSGPDLPGLVDHGHHTGNDDILDVQHLRNDESFVKRKSWTSIPHLSGSQVANHAIEGHRRETKDSVDVHHLASDEPFLNKDIVGSIPPPSAFLRDDQLLYSTPPPPLTVAEHAGVADVCGAPLLPGALPELHVIRFSHTDSAVETDDPVPCNSIGEAIGDERADVLEKAATDDEDEFLNETEVVESRFGKLSTFVRGSSFDYISGALVVLNAISLGVQTDWQARNESDETRVAFKVIETLFCIIFTLELSLRVVAYGRDFLKLPHVGWHLFDCVLVGTQLMDEIVFLVLLTNGTSSSDGASAVGAMRMMRVLRLVRVVRLVRVIRLIGELRTIVLSIVGCFKALIWAMALLLLIMYIVGLYVTQIALDSRLTAKATGDAVSEGLVMYFGSLGDTILSLYQAVTGGEDWNTFLKPLRRDVSPALVPLFMFYIAFGLLCMLNLITGVFVESACKEAKKDKDSYIMNHVRSMFATIDVDGSGTISWDEFSSVCDSKGMMEVFADIDTDIAEAKKIFRLLDEDDSGNIDPEEFVKGFGRLRGPAKSLDLQLLMRETIRLEEMYLQNWTTVEMHLRQIARSLSGETKTQEPCSKASPMPNHVTSLPSLNTLDALSRQAHGQVEANGAKPPAWS